MAVTTTYLDDLEKALDCLRKGGILLYPTDTIWGLGCDATNEEAVARLFELKQRPTSKAMISLVDSMETLRRYVKAVPSDAEREMTQSERPTTVIFPHPFGISSKLMAPDGSAAFRIPNAEYVSELCRRLGNPIVSSSANISGAPAPSKFDDISDEIRDLADYLCLTGRDAGSTKASRILKIEESDTLTIIRE